MKRYVRCAELIEYNANTRGINTDDCVIRSISLVLDLDYNYVNKSLNNINQEYKKYPSVYDKFLKDNGVPNEIECSEDITVEDFCDKNYSGTYLIECARNKKRMKHGSHLVACIDGKIFDSWDCREYKVCGYYVISGRKSIELTDIKDHMTELDELAKSLISNLVDKYINKYNIKDYEFQINPGISTIGYTLYENCVINIFHEDAKFPYTFSIKYVFKPDTSFDDAKSLIQKITKVRIYDRLYEITKDFKGKLESYEILKTTNKSDHKVTLYDNRSKRFYNSLPGWSKMLVTEILIQYPGEYYDSYRVTMIPLPEDGDQTEVEFYGYNSDNIKTEMDMYRNKGYVRPGEDYSISDIF